LAVAYDPGVNTRGSLIDGGLGVIRFFNRDSAPPSQAVVVLSGLGATVPLDSAHDAVGFNNIVNQEITNEIAD
jgi:hypothetical protein